MLDGLVVRQRHQLAVAVVAGSAAQRPTGAPECPAPVTCRRIIELVQQLARDLDDELRRGEIERGRAQQRMGERDAMPQRRCTAPIDCSSSTAASAPASRSTSSGPALLHGLFGEGDHDR